MADVEAWARTRGASETSLWVVEGNDPALAMYQALGYQITLDRQKITVPPVRWEVRLRKRLTGG
jgi:GNAT superfamily N-acetyltransferase